MVVDVSEELGVGHCAVCVLCSAVSLPLALCCSNVLKLVPSACSVVHNRVGHGLAESRGESRAGRTDLVRASAVGLGNSAVRETRETPSSTAQGQVGSAGKRRVEEWRGGMEGSGAPIFTAEDVSRAYWWIGARIT